MSNETFNLTKDHLKLLARMRVEWFSECYEGAPNINFKRPYGNGGVYEDIHEILTGEIVGYSREKLTEEEVTRYRKMHRETEKALQIVLCTQSFKPGIYEKTKKHNDISWELIDG